ncbi:MAG: hypothetical protein ACFFAS_05170 [Promethearchaeota archaeon]
MEEFSNDNNNEWETKRHALIRILTQYGSISDLKAYMKEMEYSNKRQLITDIISISKSLKKQNKILKILPASCVACGFQFVQKKNEFKIPSKCPKCRQQRIEWPSLRL